MKTKYIVEQRNGSGKLISSGPKKGFEKIMGLDGVDIDDLLWFANEKDNAWKMGEFGHEIGTIGPCDIDGWLHKNGLARRKIYWK